MNRIIDIKNKLFKVKLNSLWKKEFYFSNEAGITPINLDYMIEKPFRILYDGIFSDDEGFILEINVGIISNDFGYYEFFVEDYMGSSVCECYEKFDDALKRFVKFTKIRKPKIFIDDEKGNAVLINYQVKPYSTIRI